MSIRNVAIIAHVDHGKTTLVDAILKQTGVYRKGQAVTERVLDSNALERERGITILAKNTAVFYRGTKINIVDTPGHSDFGGEVERILSMVDGALLIVDAAEGPLNQTRYVLRKALAQKAKPIVVINKIDRPDARSEAVLDAVLELFIDIGASEADIDFPVLYGSGRVGIIASDLARATAQVAAGEGSVEPLLDAILTHIPPPSGDPARKPQLLVTMLDYDDYIGRLGIGRIQDGTLAVGQDVGLVHGDGPVRKARVAQLFGFERLQRVPIEQAVAGEIVAIGGTGEIEIGDTVTSPDEPAALPPLSVDEPTLTMIFRVNDSPLAGREGDFVTSRHLRDRLWREARTNVALRVSETESADAFEVSGRGELHLGILIETMRREGYEFAVSKPQVITRVEHGQIQEPLEYLIIEIPQDYVGTTIETLGSRRAELVHMGDAGGNEARLEFIVPARGLIGFTAQFLVQTRGYGTIHHSFHAYGPERGEIPGRTSGSMIAWEPGISTSYALENVQERGVLFIGPGVEVYEGMIVGENARPQDLDVNVAKKKHVTNMRSSTSEIDVKLEPPRVMSLEESLAWIADDELVEVTPKSIRLRKLVLRRDDRQKRRAKPDAVPGRTGTDRHASRLAARIP